MPPVAARQDPMGKSRTVAGDRGLIPNRNGDLWAGWVSRHNSPPATLSRRRFRHDFVGLCSEHFSWPHSFGRFRRPLDRLTDIQEEFRQLASYRHGFRFIRYDTSPRQSEDAGANPTVRTRS
jgi:hypothetical protein